MKFFNQLTNFEITQTKDFEPYVKLECAERGILVPQKPTPETLFDVPELKPIALKDALKLAYGDNLVFNKPEEINAFLQLDVQFCSYYDSDRSSGGILHDKSFTHIKIPIYSDVEKKAYDQITKRNDEIEKRNKAALTSYENSLSDFEAIWEEFNNKIQLVWEKVRNFEKVKRTAQEYSLLTEGQDSITLKLLEKIFTREEIVEAKHWFAKTPKTFWDATAVGHVFQDNEVSPQEPNFQVLLRIEG
jgi:hypothetical protein